MSTVYNRVFFSDVILGGVRDKLVNTPSYIYMAIGDSDDLERNEYTSHTLSDVILGKRIVDDNIIDMIARNQWVSGTVYNRDDGEVDSDYFIITSLRSVYKCIDNNYGAVSTIEPLTKSNTPITLADGYTWQYIFTVSDSALGNFGTPTLIPVRGEFITGTSKRQIDYIDIVSPGIGYITDTGGINFVSNDNTFGINSNADSTPMIFVGMDFSITGGPGVNQVARITDYFSNSSGKFIRTADNIPGTTLSSSYMIAPAVEIKGSGTDAVARSIVTNGQISEIILLNRGHDYNVVSAEIIGGQGSGATLTVGVSPQNGHGSNPAAELNSRALLIHNEIIGDELETIPDNVEFNKVGILTGAKDLSGIEYSDDTFNNTAVITYTPIISDFDVGDLISYVTGDNPCEVIHKDGNTITVISRGYLEIPYSVGEILTDGTARVEIDSIETPNVNLRDASIYSINKINPITRSEISAEIISTILQF